MGSENSTQNTRSNAPKTNTEASITNNLQNYIPSNKYYAIVEREKNYDTKQIGIKITTFDKALVNSLVNFAKNKNLSYEFINKNTQKTNAFCICVYIGGFQINATLHNLYTIGIMTDVGYVPNLGMTYCSQSWGICDRMIFTKKNYDKMLI